MCIYKTDAASGEYKADTILSREDRPTDGRTDGWIWWNQYLPFQILSSGGYIYLLNITQQLPGANNISHMTC